MKKSRKNDGWAEAKRICRLSAEDVEKAKKLGFQPKSLIKNVPSPSQRWKMPVREWVGDLYEKKFGRVGKSPRQATKDNGLPHYTFFSEADWDSCLLFDQVGDEGVEGSTVGEDEGGLGFVVVELEAFDSG
jgi:hypothetical protein